MFIYLVNFEYLGDNKNVRKRNIKKNTINYYK